MSWRRAVEAHPDVAVLRSDGYDNVMAIVWLLMRHADWSTMTTRPTWAVLMECTGLSKSTVGKWLAWLHTRGLLGTVTHGSTVRYRKGTQCGSIDDGLGNIAAEYVLAIPTALDPAPAAAPSKAPNASQSAAQPDPAQTTAAPASPVEAVGRPTSLTLVDITRTPSEFPSVGGELPPRTRTSRARTRETTATVDQELAAATRASKRQAKIIKDRALTIADQVRARSLDLRRLSAKHVRHLILDLVIAGWTAADVVYAIDHTPDGQARTLAGTAKHPAGWFRHRLSVWHDADGHPFPSRSQRLAAAAAHRDSERQALAEQRAALQAARVDADTGPAARARAMLAAASSGAAAAMTRQALARPTTSPAASTAASTADRSAQQPTEHAARRDRLYVVQKPAPDSATPSTAAGTAGRQERAAGPSEPESAFYASLGVEARAVVDGALSEREIVAQRRWLARTQNAHTIAGRRDPVPVGAGQRGAVDRPADQDSDQSSGQDCSQDSERAWLIQMMAARTQQESR